VKTFLTQCLAQDHACRTAVATAKARGWLPPSASPATGASCRARNALAAEGLQRAVEHTAAALEACASAADLWMGRHVRGVDGTGMALPDTPATQDDYPQPSEQKPGGGFPVLRLVALMSLTTGAIGCYTIGSLHAHEQRLFPALRLHLKAGEVVLGDRHFGTFANLVLLKRQGVDGVFRRHQARTTEAQTIRRLGQEDHLVRWHIRANRSPVWLDPAVDFPRTFVVREVTFRVAQPGFRPQVVTLVTTLGDAEAYPPAVLAALYCKRWRMELWLRDIKTTMDMDMLRTKTPPGVRAEVAMFMVGYNLIRTVRFDASQMTETPREQLSFQSALGRLRLWWAHGTSAMELVGWLLAYKPLLDELARDGHPARPGRSEPRVVKRRPKPFPRMQQPRRV
jgi:DDE family transposase